MTLPIKDDVRQILRDFEPRIRAVLKAAWDEWVRMPDRSRFSPRSRASIVFDFIKKGAIDEFASDQDIRIIPKGQTAHFLFKDHVLVRFKKANGAGLGSSIETQAVLEFIDHEQMIPGLLPELSRVEICYHLDDLATQMEMIAVTARQQHQRIWSYEIEQPPSAQVMPIPRQPDGDIPPTEVRIRKIEADDSKLGE